MNVVKQMKKALMVCPSCGQHLRMDARARIEATVDAGSFGELFTDLKSEDFFHFPGYADKLEKAEKLTIKKLTRNAPSVKAMFDAIHEE